MRTDQGWGLRLAVLSKLIKKAPQKPGRTALMKFAYLLQTVKRVPLGYQFALYNYGPYDSAVLTDLSQAVSLKAAKCETVHFPTGYAYEYSSNEKGHKSLCDRIGKTLDHCEEAIDWVLEEFGRESASRLELISTIIFAEREMRRKRETPKESELSQRVKRIKPHFDDVTISDTVADLATRELIKLS